MGVDPMGELRALGYEFRDGQLRQVGGNAGFVFQGGNHYDALAEATSQYVPLLLEEEAHLNPLWLPLGVGPGDGCPVFVTAGYEKAERLLLIIQGMGKVRAGVWGCSLCINDSLDQGTMIPYLQRAMASGYGVVVFNPNENTNDGVPVPGLENFNSHVAYVMDKVVLPRCSAEKIDIVAHSHGGRALLSYLGRSGGNAVSKTLLKRLHRLVFTDSYHVQTQLTYLPKCVRELLNDPSRTVNFVPHSAPLGTQVQEWISQDYTFSEVDRGCLCLSAGVQDHPATNYAAMSAVFEFLEAQCHGATPSPHNLLIDSLECLSTSSSSAPSCSSDDVHLSVPVSNEYEDNNMQSPFNLEGNLANGSIGNDIVDTDCNAKKKGQWSRLRLKNFLRMLRKTGKNEVVSI